jgi:hypothetical protein
VRRRVKPDAAINVYAENTPKRLQFDVKARLTVYLPQGRAAAEKKG